MLEPHLAVFFLLLPFPTSILGCNSAKNCSNSTVRRGCEVRTQAKQRVGDMGEGECGSSTPSSNSKNATTAPHLAGGGAAAKYLSNLPSRGLFSSTVLSSNPGGMRVYICDHDTSPPEDQLIKTDQMNILIRSLMLKKQKAESGPKDGKGVPTSENSRKRGAERALDGRTSAKKAASSSQAASRQEGTKNRMPDREYQSMTVERLRALLKEKGLSPRGKKDELIARLKESLEQCT